MNQKEQGIKRKWSLNAVILILLGLPLMFFLNGCVSIKEYQKMYLNDPDMQLEDAAIERFESGFQSYREGVSGANGGKSGGGCGCN